MQLAHTRRYDNASPDQSTKCDARPRSFQTRARSSRRATPAPMRSLQMTEISFTNEISVTEYDTTGKVGEA